MKQSVRSSPYKQPVLIAEHMQRYIVNVHCHERQAPRAIASESSFRTSKEHFTSVYQHDAMMPFDTMASGDLEGSPTMCFPNRFSGSHALPYWGPPALLGSLLLPVRLPGRGST